MEYGGGGGTDGDGDAVCDDDEEPDGPDVDPHLSLCYQLFLY